MNIHDQMETLTDLYVAGGLTAGERGEIDRHIAECAACASRLRDAREFSAWARGLIKNDAPPADLEDRVIARFRAAGQSKRRRFPVGKRFFKITGSIAAAVALIFLGDLTDVQPAANGKEMHVQFTLDHDAHDHPTGATEIGSAKTRGLKTITSAEDDFRATDRNWGELAWAGTMGAPSNNFTYFFGRDLGRADRGVDVLNGSNKGETTRFGWDGGELAARRLTEGARVESKFRSKGDKSGEALDDGLGLVAPNQGGGVHTGGKTIELERMKAQEDAKPTAKSDLAARVGELKDQVAEFTLKEPATAAPAPVTTPKPTPPVQDNRKIIRTAEVSLEVDSYDATYTKLGELVTAEKGLVASANTQKAANGKISATVVVRVPPERFESVLAKLKDFGTIRNQNVDSEDVTKAYIDLETRLKSKEILAERLKKLLAEGKGTVKELMEVEVQLGATNEAIESIKGEIKYYDNRIGLSTLTLQIAEKDLGQPFEVVQTLQANLALTARDPDDVYAKAQKEITDAGGQVVDSRMTRQNDGSSTGFVRGRVDADKFQALRESLKKYGVATNDTVNQQKTARGGRDGAPKPDAPLRKEQAVIDLTISSPPIFVTRRSQVLVETPTVDTAYQAARKAVEGAGGKIVDGSLTGRVDGMQATLRIQIDADKFQALLDSLKTAGKVKNANVNSVLPAASTEGGAPLLRERAEIDFALVTPPQLIGEEHGLWKSVQDTLAKSWTGFLWSIEKLFVGISLAGPWILLVLVGIVLWRKRKKAVVGK